MAGHAWLRFRHVNWTKYEGGFLDPVGDVLSTDVADNVVSNRLKTYAVLRMKWRGSDPNSN